MNSLRGTHPIPIGVIAWTMSLTGCFAGPGFLKQNEAFKIQEAAIQIQSVGEITQGTVSAASMTTQTLAAAAGSSIAGVKLSVQPGTFTLDASIALEESATLADGNMSQNLGVTLTAAAGKAVSITAEGLGSAELSKPMTLAIPLSTTSLMLAESEKILVIVYRSYKDGETLDGILPPDKITIRNNQAVFDIVRWGAYQPAYVPKAEEAKVAAVQEVKTEAKIITATVMKTMPQATISALKITKSDGRIVTFSATLTNADLKTCYLDAYDTKSSERHYEEISGPTSRHDFSQDYRAMSFMVRIGCTLLDGRVLETAYTLFELPAIERPAQTSTTTTTQPSGGGSTGPMPACDYSENHPCSEGLEQVWIADETGASLPTVNAAQTAYFYMKLAAGYAIDFSMATPNNITNYCWHVPSATQPMSRMSGGCESSWEVVGDAVNRVYRRPFTAHKWGVNHGIYQVASLRFQDTMGRVFGYFIENPGSLYYWNSSVPVAAFTYVSAYGNPVDVAAPVVLSVTAATSSVAVAYDEDNTDPLRISCITLAETAGSNMFRICPSSSGGFMSFSTYLSSVTSMANGATVNAGTHYIKEINFEDSASNWITYFADAPNGVFYYYNNNMTRTELAGVTSPAFAVNP